MAEAMSDERQDANWYDDARITEAQLDAIRSDLGSTGRAQYSRAAMRKVMAEIERLQGHLNAIAVAHEEGVQARRRLDEIRDQEKAELKTRAETAERELAELRATLRPEYGLRYPSKKSGDPDEHLGSASDEATACLLAARGDTIMRRYRTDWEEVRADGQQ